MLLGRNQFEPHLGVESVQIKTTLLELIGFYMFDFVDSLHRISFPFLFFFLMEGRELIVCNEFLRYMSINVVLSIMLIILIVFNLLGVTGRLINSVTTCVI